MSDFSAHEAELGGVGLELRPAAPEDADLIRRIVGLAMFWDGDSVPLQLPADGEKYFVDWGRPGDIGVLVFRGIEFLGGASVRRFGAADGAYGYVSDEFPELTIGIEAGARRQGIGVLALAALKAKVLAAGSPGISLSVNPENGARHLYRQLGFTLVEDRGHDLLMLWEPRRA